MFSLAWFQPFFEGLFFGVVAMLLHESGHIAAALLLGIRVKSVRLGWKGLYTVREMGTPAENLFISLAGPCTNLLLLLLWRFSQDLFLANLCYGVVNLLPIQASDGERVLRLLKQMRSAKAAGADAPHADTLSSGGR
ncbi:MAG TPA: M50 family metallopeptidase [Terracidiphilus sp.]|nr:M50 family metallopeptidase [Terracidiphilus sp.]